VPTRLRTPLGREVMMQERNMIVSAMICLPDTVDPRGPQGK
jgi:hypothetical protein